MIEDEYMKIVNEITNCTKCRLYRYRKNTVPGEGGKYTKIMFIGEAPGSKEDDTGRPFVGSAGKLLTSLIEGIGLKRQDVYITNILKCRPPNNRDPLEDEIITCLPYLKRQLKLIRPKLIVTLGRHSSRVILDLSNIKFRSMSREHGNVYSCSIEGFKTIVIPTYHPAAALYNPNIKKLILDDFQKIKEYLDKRAQEPKEGPLDKYLK